MREDVIGPLAMNSSSALRANRSRHVVSQVFCATNRVTVNDVPFPASVLRPERLGEHEHERRRRKLVRNVFDAPLQSPESRVPAPEHFSRLNFRKTRDLFLQQRRRLDGDRRASALARGGVRGGVRARPVAPSPSSPSSTRVSRVPATDAGPPLPASFASFASFASSLASSLASPSPSPSPSASASSRPPDAASSPRARFAGDASSLRRVLARRALARGAFVVAARPIARRGASRRRRGRSDLVRSPRHRSTRLNFKTDAVGHSVTKRRDTSQNSRERGRRKTAVRKTSDAVADARGATRARDDGWAANVEIVAVDRDTPRRRGHRAAGGRATARWRRIGANSTRGIISSRRREAARARARGGGERRDWRETASRALGLRHRDESAGGRRTLATRIDAGAGGG